MSLTTSEMTPADISAVVNRNNGVGYSDGFGGGNGIWWIIVLFLIAAMFGWGGNNAGFYGGNGGGAMPYVINTTNDVQRGFDQSAIMGSLGNITSAISNGFANAEISRCNANTNLLQTLNAMSAQQANCCCENRLATQDLKYTIATEACADRAAVTDGIRDIIASQTAGIQTILDKLCQQEIDAKNDRISELQQQLYMKDLAASQIAQTAQITAGQAAEVNALYQRLRDCPVPTMPVYGMQPIFSCSGNNNGCGCGFNGNF